MNLSVFEELPDQAPLWVYAFERPLGVDEMRLVEESLTAFMREWHSHKKDVYGVFAIVHDRFVILSGASRDGISGCSIDSSVAQFKHFRDEHGLNGLNRNLVFYRDTDGAIQSSDRAGFRAAAADGRVGPTTMVFDTTVPTLGALRSGRFELPLSGSWHAGLLPTHGPDSSSAKT
jgi:hypothetical protein